MNQQVIEKLVPLINHPILLCVAGSTEKLVVSTSEIVFDPIGRIVLLIVSGVITPIGLFFTVRQLLLSNQNLIERDPLPLSDALQQSREYLEENRNTLQTLVTDGSLSEDLRTQLKDILDGINVVDRNLAISSEERVNNVKNIQGWMASRKEIWLNNLQKSRKEYSKQIQWRRFCHEIKQILLVVEENIQSGFATTYDNAGKSTLHYRDRIAYKRALMSIRDMMWDELENHTPIEEFGYDERNRLYEYMSIMINKGL